MESIVQIFQDGSIWEIIIKVLLTTLVSLLIGLISTLIGKIIAKSKNSKITKYAKICVEAAEQKFPNEGTKMGPEKMAYVMDQLAIKFPKIKENNYLYNIAEAAVYELNNEKKKALDIKEFKEKYGEDPILTQMEESLDEDYSHIIEDVKESITEVVEEDLDSVEDEKIDSTPSQAQSKTSSTSNIKLSSF